MQTSTDLLTPEELGRCLKIKPMTVLTWARTGRIPAIKITHRVVRFDLSAVLKALGVNVSA